MKKVILLLVGVAFLAGCSITPKTKQVEVTSIPTEKLRLSIPNPEPLELRDVGWVIVTEANIDEVWQMLKDDNEGVALFALRHGVRAMAFGLCALYCVGVCSFFFKFCVQLCPGFQ